jgi:hypothetical protein
MVVAIRQYGKTYDISVPAEWSKAYDTRSVPVRLQSILNQMVADQNPHKDYRCKYGVHVEWQDLDGYATCVVTLYGIISVNGQSLSYRNIGGAWEEISDDLQDRFAHEICRVPKLS